MEQNDEWLVPKRYLSLHSLAALTGADHGPYGPAEAGPPALDEIGAVNSVGLRRVTCGRGRL